MTSPYRLPKNFAVGALLLLGTLHLARGEELPAAPKNYFNDYAGVTSETARYVLNERLAKFDKDTTAQVLVAIFPKMDSTLSLDEYTLRIAKAWGVGQGLTLLPNGSLLTVDTGNGTNSEKFDPATGQWTSAGSTGVQLPDRSSFEIGPAIQRPDGTVVCFGGIPHTSIFNTVTSTWAPGPDFPGGNDMADGPASILPDGTILVYASSGVFQKPANFFVFDGITFTQGAATQTSTQHTSYEGRFILLPTGQVLWLVADGRTIDVEVSTSTGLPNRAWQPRIASVRKTLRLGSSSNPISGTQFNGLSVGCDYGDDATMASNYPLVRITNTATGHVIYARTHDHSTMAIATGNTIVSTTFDVPATAEPGASTLEVVANGIASRSVPVNLR